MSTALRDGVKGLETMTRMTLAVLSLASGVYTYLGVHELLGGNSTSAFFAAVIYSVAVSIGIYAFWTYMMRFMPHMLDRGGRGLLFGCMLLGSAMIVAMSSWLNASALAGSAALQQHLATTLESYSRDLDRAHRQALAAQNLVPDIQLASAHFAQLADSERKGSLTGSSGSGMIVQLLSQMSSQLGGLSKEVTQSADRVKTLYDDGSKRLAAMRELISAHTPISARSDAFGAEAQALMGVIASLHETSVAPAVKRAAQGMASGFIAPAAGGKSNELATRQTAMIGKVEAAVAAQSTALSAAVDRLLAAPAIEPARFQSISQAEAVLRYASDFIPSWAGAISIDLMPAVLVLILCVVHAGIRRSGAVEMSSTPMTSRELITALRQMRELERAQATEERAVDEAIAIATDSAPQPPVRLAEVRG